MSLLFTMAVVSALFYLILLSIPTRALVTRAPILYRRHAASTLTVALQSSSNSNNDNDEMDLSHFNPFQYKNRGSSGIGMSGTQISLRKTNMQALVGQLLSVYGDSTLTNDTLNKYKDFLLEPLDDLEAPLDPESIYNGITTRKERYQAYRESMEERIATANDAKAKQVLTTMMDYVLQFE